MTTDEVSTDLIVYERTGEIISRTDLGSMAKVVGEIDRVLFEEKRIRSALSDAIVEWWNLHGGPRTIHVDGATVTIGSAAETVYDDQALMENLREAGMPEEDIALHVRETVAYKVDAVRVRQTEKNPRYAEAIAAARTTREKNPTVGVKVG
jgi:NACalpha-BTF3-like transcription factor